MEMQNWKHTLLPYNQAVDELKVKFKSIRKEFIALDEYSPIEFVTGRVKKISSILEKAQRKNIPAEEIEEKVEDIAGIRIMCQFVEDIHKVIEIIRARDGKDLIVAEERDYITNIKPSGYRSYHIIIKYPVQTGHGEKWIFAEIQIRTLSMNFWATIEHSLNYKYKQQIPTEIKQQLKLAADAAFNLDEQMLEIKDEIKDAQKLFEIKSDIISNIMSRVLTLHSLGKNAEASRYEILLNKLLEDGEVFELTNLLQAINRDIEKFRD